MADDARSFSLQLNQEWAAKVDDLEEAVALIGLQAFRGIVQKSPVDKGRFRGNWNTSIGEANFATTENVDPSGSATIASATATLGNYDATEGFPEINISNGLEYGPALEDGHSGQAPNGMVQLTITEIEAQFDGMEV